MKCARRNNNNKTAAVEHSHNKPDFAFAEDVRRSRRVPQLFDCTACPHEIHVPVALFVLGHAMLETLPRVWVFNTL